MQTPADFAVISALVIFGSLIGAGCGMRPKQLDDWEVIPNLWGACVGRPSIQLKSPCMKEVMVLLERLQAKYSKKFELEKAKAEFNTIINTAKAEELKALLKKATNNAKISQTEGVDLDELKAQLLEAKVNEAAEITQRLFKTNETSIQSMTVLQKQNKKGILVFRDELIGLFSRWEKENWADERSYFLEGWNGNGSFTDFKISRGLTDAGNICISLLGGIQPDILERYHVQAQRGKNDGLMQRLQLAVWPDEPKEWELIDTKPNNAEKQRAYNIN